MNGPKLSGHQWSKRGQLVIPDPSSSWFTTHAGPSFVDTTSRTPQLYLTGRDSHNRSHIGVFELSISGGEINLIENTGRLVLSPGTLGTFDESGVSYPWLVHHENQIFMYYVGWVAGGRARFQNYTGLAISRDGGKTFVRQQVIPILDRTSREPFGSGSCAVWIDDSGWKMIYTSFDPWIESGTETKPSYRLREAVSEDGVSWRRTNRVVVDFEHPGEHIIGKPMLLADEKVTRLWYSYRGSSYRIGYAESTNGDDFVRMDHLAGIDVSDAGWDSEMIEYAYVFDFEQDRYMVYNGNGFGITGLGYACLDKQCAKTPHLGRTTNP